MSKIYMVVDFEAGFYDGDIDYTYLKAISTDLDKLCNSFNKKPISGELLEIDESVFDTSLMLTLSNEGVDSQPGIENKGNFSSFVKEYLKTKSNKPK